MLDIKRIKENPDGCKARLRDRNADYDAQIDRLLQIDEKRRQIIYTNEQLKARQNQVSKQVPQIKKEGGDTDALFAQMKELASTIKTGDVEQKALEQEQEAILLSIPNLPNERVPQGRDDTDNKELRRYGEPTAFYFEPKPHWELGEELGILDPATAAKVTGARFHFYYGAGAAIERAIYNFYLDTHSRKNGYLEVIPPYMVNRASMTGTGQLPKFEEDAFHLDNFDYFMIPTAEVPVTNMHRDEILDGSSLPRKYCAYTACFRAEAGSAGRDTRGLIRQHQFNKVELVKFARPENSYEELETLTDDAESVLRALGLPHRAMLLSTGDLGFSSAMTIDLEVWMPSYNRYVEISSCSNFEDFQARRANIRFRDSKDDKTNFVHTLNGSGVAVGRTVAAILENFQNADGSVTVPEPLRPYMGGLERIEKQQQNKKI